MGVIGGINGKVVRSNEELVCNDDRKGVREERLWNRAVWGWNWGYRYT